MTFLYWTVVRKLSQEVKNQKYSRSMSVPELGESLVERDRVYRFNNVIVLDVAVAVLGGCGLQMVSVPDASNQNEEYVNRSYLCQIRQYVWGRGCRQLVLRVQKKSGTVHALCPVFDLHQHKYLDSRRNKTSHVLS